MCVCERERERDYEESICFWLPSHIDIDILPGSSIRANSLIRCPQTDVRKLEDAKNQSKEFPRQSYCNENLATQYSTAGESITMHLICTIQENINSFHFTGDHEKHVAVVAEQALQDKLDAEANGDKIKETKVVSKLVAAKKWRRNNKKGKSKIKLTQEETDATAMHEKEEPFETNGQGNYIDMNKDVSEEESESNSEAEGQDYTDYDKDVEADDISDKELNESEMSDVETYDSKSGLQVPPERTKTQKKDQKWPIPKEPTKPRTIFGTRDAPAEGTGEMPEGIGEMPEGTKHVPVNRGTKGGTSENTGKSTKAPADGKKKEKPEPRPKKVSAKEKGKAKAPVETKEQAKARALAAAEALKGTGIKIGSGEGPKPSSVNP